jgi:hypothetical protein
MGLGVAVGGRAVGVAEGGGGGSKIMGLGVAVGGRAVGVALTFGRGVVEGGGGGSKIIGLGVAVGGRGVGVALTFGRGVPDGGGGGSQIIGISRQLTLAPPNTTIIVRMACCKCLGILFHGSMISSLIPATALTLVEPVASRQSPRPRFQSHKSHLAPLRPHPAGHLPAPILQLDGNLHIK